MGILYCSTALYCRNTHCCTLIIQRYAWTAAEVKSKSVRAPTACPHPPCFHAVLLVPAREIAALQAPADTATRAAAATIPAMHAHQLVKYLCAAHPLPPAMKHLMPR